MSSLTIDHYLDELKASGELEIRIRETLDDYHKHKDYTSISTWNGVLKDYTSQKAEASEDQSDELSYDQQISIRYLKNFDSIHNTFPSREFYKGGQLIQCVQCPWEKNHTTQGSDTETVRIISRNGMINFYCHHSHCEGKKYSDYKAEIEKDGKAVPGKIQDQRHKDSKEASKQFDIKLVAGKDLQAMDLPPIFYPIEKMIPQGYTVASAPFKYGKSWLALEMCLAVAEGKDFLGQHTSKGASVYFALEDCDQFAQERLNIALDNKEAPEGFYYIMEGVPTLDDGLLDYLNKLYETVSNLKLVVIDVLAKVEYQPKRGESAYKCDYRTGGALKKWADDHRISLIAITHTTKMTHPEDIFMNTTGSSGVSGAADALLTIAKEKRTDKDALLAITGRRVRELYMKVHLDGGFLWTSDGEVDPDTMEADKAEKEREKRLEEYRSSDIRKSIIKIADMDIKDELTARQIIDLSRDNDIYLLSTSKEIGAFICRFQNYLFSEDGIKAFIRKRGTASNVYKFEIWEQAPGEIITLFE